MEYLLAWRMAVAKDLLRRQDLGLHEVAERVGYGSASTFSTAFSRHVGLNSSFSPILVKSWNLAYISKAFPTVHTRGKSMSDENTVSTQTSRRFL